MSPDAIASLGGLVVEASVRATFVAAIVSMILMAARVRSSSVLHAAWTAVLGAMLLMPVLPRSAAAVSVPVTLPASSFVEALPGLSDAATPPAASWDQGAPGTSSTPSNVARAISPPSPPQRPSWPQAIMSLPESDRLQYLIDNVELVFSRGDDADYYVRQNPDRGAVLGDPQLHFTRARDYAVELLALAEKYPGHPGYGTAILRGNMTLASYAFRQGDKSTALEYLRAATATPGSDEIAYYLDSTLRFRLVNYLLKYGERETVAEFLEQLARVSVRNRSALLRDAAAIRKGRMPQSYQSMMARGE
ncbi:MAG TPA: hypothetical protein VLD67_20425 [Vicinamibacterales bacterium]|nr:hypothetical protein [Vicinamibacterales bacterium]